MITKLSLIIPVYNAEAFILDSLVQLTEWKQNRKYLIQIILVNDGSNDLTRTIIDDYIANKDLYLPENAGKLKKVKKSDQEAKDVIIDDI